MVDNTVGTNSICWCHECNKLHGWNQWHHSGILFGCIGFVGSSEYEWYFCRTEFDHINDSSFIGVLNFRPKGKAKCFAGDVGSISIAFIILFLLGNVMIRTTDITWLVFLLVYGVDGCMTIVHRIMLHENLGEAHRKHAYQIMANELKIGHVKVTSLYMIMQLLISLGFIYLCPNTVLAHWLYMVTTLVVLVIAYILFMKKYYHLHEEYLASLKK